MNSKDIRHASLLNWLSTFSADEDFLRAINNELAKLPGYKSGFSASYLSQLKNRDRNIGDKTARKLEIGLGLSEGEFDQMSSNGSPAPRNENVVRDILSSYSDPKDVELGLTLEKLSEEDIISALMAFKMKVTPAGKAKIIQVFSEALADELSSP